MGSQISVALLFFYKMLTLNLDEKGSIGYLCSSSDQCLFRLLEMGEVVVVVVV